jgi:hypothetical protein
MLPTASGGRDLVSAQMHCAVGTWLGIRTLFIRQPLSKVAQHVPQLPNVNCASALPDRVRKETACAGKFVIGG